MIELRKGNIFQSKAEAWVNTVNTVGVMGKGIALQFKERFPENFELYKQACEAGEVQVGKMYITKVKQIEGPKWIINFPTKKHWMHRSSYSFIEEGLKDLTRVVAEKQIQSIALPPLGAGQGGLDWVKVKNLIEEHLHNLPVAIELYEPSFQPAIEKKETSVRLTKARALILALINKYRVLGFDTTHLEIQKLAYFLQRMGQHDLRLQYKQFYYGPFAYNLQHLLKYLEGNYLIGDTRVMDAKPLDNIRLREDKLNEVNEFIENHCSPSEKGRLEKVYSIIEGFESPFGVELLSTVDWIMAHKKETRNHPEKIYDEVSGWSERKASMMTTGHIGLATQRLNLFQHELYLN